MSELIDALRQDPVVELPISPACSVEIVARRWQSDPDTQITDALPYTIKGPSQVISLIQREAMCSTLDSAGALFNGYLSPPHAVTISSERARRAGIPPNSAFYAFAYPLESLSGQYERLVGGREAQADPWLLFLLLGGYCYFDSDRKLIQTNALVMAPTGYSLSLAGPFRPSHAAVAGLGATGRLRELTLLPLREKGFEHVAWVNPGERPGGCAALLANGGDLPNNGAFVYQAASGEAVVFSVINKALLGIDETANGVAGAEYGAAEDAAGAETEESSRGDGDGGGGSITFATPLSLSGRLSQMARSGRIEHATQHLQKWNEASAHGTAVNTAVCTSSKGEQPVTSAQGPPRGTAAHQSSSGANGGGGGEHAPSAAAECAALLSQMRRAIAGGSDDTPALLKLIDQIEDGLMRILPMHGDGGGERAADTATIDVKVVGEGETARPGGGVGVRGLRDGGAGGSGAERVPSGGSCCILM